MIKRDTGSNHTLSYLEGIPFSGPSPLLLLPDLRFRLHGAAVVEQHPLGHHTASLKDAATTDNDTTHTRTGALEKTSKQ